MNSYRTCRLRCDLATEFFLHHEGTLSWTLVAASIPPHACLDRAIPFYARNANRRSVQPPRRHPAFLPPRSHRTSRSRTGSQVPRHHRRGGPARTRGTSCETRETQDHARPSQAGSCRKVQGYRKGDGEPVRVGNWRTGVQATQVARGEDEVSRCHLGETNRCSWSFCRKNLPYKVREHALVARDAVDGPLTPRNVCSTNSGVIGATFDRDTRFMRLHSHVLVFEIARISISPRFVVSHACIFCWYLLSLVRAMRRTG